MRCCAELISSPIFMHSQCSLPLTAVQLNTIDATLSAGYVILCPAFVGSFRTIPRKIKYARIFVGGRGKDKVHPRTGHEGPEVELRCSCTLSLTSALHGVGGRYALAALPPRNAPVPIL